MLKEILNDNLDEVKGCEYAVVDFNATWCGPCKMMAPVLDDLANEYAGKVEFFGCDVDENQYLAQEYGIMSIPCLGFFKNGEQLDQSIGFKPKQVIAAWIEGHLN
ncbi:MAG: thioredoxin [Lachnospiraceae bacterium]|nr:thioredoxin [Lachnospiraceae bacterium]